MNNLFTKILVCIYGNSNDAALIEGALNFCRAFNCQIIVGTTEEGNRTSGEVVNRDLAAAGAKAERITLANTHFKTVAKTVEDMGIDLVVVSADKHTQSLVNSLQVPVLSILKSFKKQLIKNILMPLHDDPGTRQKIPIAAEVARVFGASINILVVTSNNKEEISKLKTYAYQAEKHFNERRVKCTYRLESGKKVEKETVEVADSANADLIIIMNDRDGGGWFSKPLSEQIMMNSNVPVLVVEPKDTTISYAQL